MGRALKSRVPRWPAGLGAARPSRKMPGDKTEAGKGVAGGRGARCNPSCYTDFSPTVRFPFHRQGHQGYGKAVSSPSPGQRSGCRVAPETRRRAVAVAVTVTVTLPGLTPPGGERPQPTPRASRPSRSPAATGARLVAPWRGLRGKFPGRGALFTVWFCSAGAPSSQASPAIETLHAGRGHRGGQRGRRAGSGPGRPRLPLPAAPRAASASMLGSRRAASLPPGCPTSLPHPAPPLPRPGLPPPPPPLRG